MVGSAPRMNAQESRAWLGLITLSETLPHVLDTQLLADAQLTHFEFTVLANLYEHRDAPMRMSRLAELTVATLPRLSHVATRMERRDLIQRVPCPDDRRATNVQLTSLGRRVFIRALPDHLELVRSLVLDALTPQQLDALGEISAAIQVRLDEHRR